EQGEAYGRAEEEDRGEQDAAVVEHGAEGQRVAVLGVPDVLSPGQDVPALDAVRGVVVEVDLARQVEAHGHEPPTVVRGKGPTVRRRPPGSREPQPLAFAPQGDVEVGEGSRRREP